MKLEEVIRINTAGAVQSGGGRGGSGLLPPTTPGFLAIQGVSTTPRVGFVWDVSYIAIRITAATFGATVVRSYLEVSDTAIADQSFPVGTPPETIKRLLALAYGAPFLMYPGDVVTYQLDGLDPAGSVALAVHISGQIRRMQDAYSLA